MTELLSALETPSDAELISRVRGGDVAAYGELFERHVEAARRLSRQLVRGPDADDLVSEAFAKVLQVLQGGGGPDVAFRAYLLTSVRRLHVDRVRAASRLQTTDDMSQFDPGVPFQDTAVAGFENGAAAKAFASLPERWQLVLWHLEVEGQKPADIAPMLGMSANSVSALAYRAREGLRQAFLTMHLSDISETECRWVNEHLGGYVRKGLSKRDATKVEAHLDGCRRCTAMYLELTEVNSNLRAIIGPLLLGGAATGYLASGGSAGAGGLFGLASNFSKLKETVAANVSTATAGAVAAGVAAAAVAGFAVMQGVNNGNDTVVGADRPIAVGTPAAPGGPTPTADATAGVPQVGVTDGVPEVVVEDSETPGESPDDLLPTPLQPPATDGPLAPGVIGPGSGPGTGPDGPGAQPDGPGTQPGDGPGTEPGGEPGTGPGTEPGGQPGTEPGTEPGGQPTAGPGQPGTGPGSDPGTQPGEDPGKTPTEPGGEPTDGPGEPGNGDNPPVVSTDLSVTGTPVVTSASLTLFVTGSPIPDHVSVALRGDLGGITFSKSAQCDVDASGTSAVCRPLPDSAAPGSAAIPASGAAGSGVIVLPWDIPNPTKPRSFDVDIDVVGNFYDTNVRNNRLHVTYLPDVVDVKLLSIEQKAHKTSSSGTDTFTFTAGLTGLPPNAAVPFTVKNLTEGGDAVISRVGDGCTVGNDRDGFTCLGLGADDTVEFDLELSSDVSAEVALTVGSIDGYPELEESDNSHTFTLTPTPEAPLTIALTPGAVPVGADGAYHLTTTIEGIPETVESLTLRVAGGTAVPDINGCEVHGDLITCSTNGATTLTIPFTVTATDVPTSIRVTVHVPEGHVDTSLLGEMDNTASSTLLPEETSEPLALTAQLNSYDKTQKSASLAITVTAAPAGQLTFSLDAKAQATLSAAGDCAITGSKSATCSFDGNGSFEHSFEIANLPSGQQRKLRLTVSAGDPAQSASVEIAIPDDEG